MRSWNPTADDRRAAAGYLFAAQRRLRTRPPLADHVQLCRAIGQELSQTMGGTSGVLPAIFFVAAGDAASSGYSLKGALKAGLERIQEVGGAQLGDRTLIDALAPALEGLDEGLVSAARKARAGANKTAEMRQGEDSQGSSA